MTTRALVDPEILPMTERVAFVEISRATLAAIRDAVDAPRADLPTPAIQPRIEYASGSRGLSDVPLHIFDPPGRHGRGAILHIHGGGMVLGSAAMRTIENADLATRLGVLLVSVDYRLAPECAFPGPQGDCYTALAWLRSSAAELGIDTGQILVMGESAGGGLAAALAQMVRDRGDAPLSGQILTYPMLDHRTGSAACPYDNASSGEYVWTRSLNAFGWESLCGDYALDDERIGWFSPIRAASLAGLPPAFIATGGLDLFVDENLAYAQRLNAASVPVELHIYPGAIHGFDMMTQSRLARQYWTDVDRAITTMLGRPAT